MPEQNQKKSEQRVSDFDSLRKIREQEAEIFCGRITMNDDQGKRYHRQREVAKLEECVRDGSVTVSHWAFSGFEPYSLGVIRAATLTSRIKRSNLDHLSRGT